MQRHDFFYELPPELIAQEPLAERSASRLLVLDGATGAFHDRTIRELPGLLAPGDLLVFNDTRVVAARLIGSKPTGGRVEIFLERPLGRDAALVHLRASKAIRDGLEIATAGGTVQVVRPRGDLWEVRLPGAPLEFFDRWGEVPLPPYIRRTPDAADRERYQSVFAKVAGAVAAPTASLHFDAALIDALAKRGIQRAFVTLHVGAGTFQPVRTETLSDHVMHAEWASVSADTCDAIAAAHERGGRVIAVGTTVARALESAALARHEADSRDAACGARSAQSGAGPGRPELGPTELDPVRPGGTGRRRAERSRLSPWSGDTTLFIRPGFSFQVIDALITNFHLPESTLLMLVSAFAGREAVLAAYAHAVRSRYRFFSYGDAMLVTPAPGVSRREVAT